MELKIYRGFGASAAVTFSDVIINWEERINAKEI
jgi:hypothetical protein